MAVHHKKQAVGKNLGTHGVFKDDQGCLDKALLTLEGALTDVLIWR